MGRDAAKLVALIGGALIVGLATSGYLPWLSQIVGGALAVVVFVWLLAKIGGDGEE